MSGNRLISDESPNRVGELTSRSECELRNNAIRDLEQVLESRPESCEEDCREEVCEDRGDRCEAEAAPNTGKAKEIVIQSLDYGYIVKVGCQTFAVETVDKLTVNLGEYLNNPSGTERKWFKEKKLL